MFENSIFKSLLSQIFLRFITLLLHRYYTVILLFAQEVLNLFVEFFIMQRTMNLTLDTIAQMHETGVKFMEAAKRVFPERNGL